METEFEQYLKCGYEDIMDFPTWQMIRAQNKQDAPTEVGHSKFNLSNGGIINDKQKNIQKGVSEETTERGSSKKSLLGQG